MERILDADFRILDFQASDFRLCKRAEVAAFWHNSTVTFSVFDAVFAKFFNLQ